jgi:hypothetical protein
MINQQFNLTKYQYSLDPNNVVELHNDDLDHDRQLTRSKYETHGGYDHHLATAMDP